MLVLRRKAGEAIVLNGVITIHVLAVEGERVKLGISAPPEVVIVRSELLDNPGAMSGPGNSYGNAPSPMRTPRPYHNPDGDMRGPGMGSMGGGMGPMGGGMGPSSSYSRYTTPTPRPTYGNQGNPGNNGANTEQSDTPAPFPTGPLRYRP